MAIYGIKAVKYCLSKNLLHYVEADAGGGQTQDIEVFNPATGQCTVTNPLTVLPCLVGSKATLTVDDAVVNRRHQYTARLTFVTADNPNLDGEYYAFVVETNEGEQMLLGSKVAPRCSVTTRQNVAATAGDINGYTTTVDFKAPYAPLRLPVTTEPVTDTREFDICCGAIAQPQQPDTREFDVCCGQIAQPPVPDTREFEVCCGEIQGEVPEPPHEDITVYVTIQFRTVPTDFGFWQSNDFYNADARRISGNYAVASQNPHTFEFPFIWSQRNPADRYDSFRIYYEIKPEFESETYGAFNRDTDILAADWSQLNAAINCTPIYNANHVQVGFYMPEYRGIIGPTPVPNT